MTPSSSPDDLPERWWELPTEEVASLIEPVRWTMACPYARCCADLDRLLRHHPSLVKTAVNQGLLSHKTAWRSSPNAPTRTALWHALELSPADTVMALRYRGATLSDEERSLTGTLPMAVVHIGRNLPEDSPLRRWAPEALFERETVLLTRLSTLNGHPLNGDDPGEVTSTAARILLPDSSLRGLIEHGVDLNAPQASLMRTTPLREIVANGEPSDLSRWLALGLTFSQGPGDDQAALKILGWALPRTGETPSEHVQRQAAYLDVLHRHGWVPGPRFRAGAMGESAHHGNDPGLLPVLMAWGARPDGRDAQGRTALHRAFRLPQGLPNVVALMELGVDPQARDRFGNTAIGVARERASSYPGAHEAFAAAITAMESAVLRAELQSAVPDGHGLPSGPGRARL